MDYVINKLLLNIPLLSFCMFSRIKYEYYHNSKKIENSANVWSQNTEALTNGFSKLSKCCTIFSALHVHWIQNVNTNMKARVLRILPNFFLSLKLF